MPSTLEGCVVRISDTIAYIGQDIEDAIRIGLIKRSDIPPDLRKNLGSTNGEIIDTLVKDVVYHSIDQSYICFSEKVSDQLLRLKKFNYQYIYHSKLLKKNQMKIEQGFKALFGIFLKDVEENNAESRIFKHFLNPKAEGYLELTSPAEKVRDFISGMTDRYFVEALQDTMLPHISL
jgi:dGTPase